MSMLQTIERRFIVYTTYPKQFIWQREELVHGNQ